MARWSLRDWRAHALLALPALLWCAPQLLFGRVAYFRDSGLYFQPHKALIADALRAGRLPEWNPFEYGGMPLLADPNFNVFHPLSLLTDLLPLPLGFGLFTCACALLAAYGGRALGRALGLGQGGALACGLFFAWSGPTVSFLLSGQAVASAGLPWLCAAGARLGRAADLRSWLLCALAAALQLLSGTPEVGACGFALAGLLCLSERLAARAEDQVESGAGRALGRASLAYLLAALLGVGLAAIQLAPSAMFLRVSSRAGGFELKQALSFSLHPARLAELVLPFFTGDIDGPGAPSWLLPFAEMPYVQQVYLGAGVVALALFGLRTAGARRRWPLLAASLLLGMVAFGKYLPGGAAAWEALPLLRVVRFPEKMIVPLSLAAAVGAGAGWERLSAAAANLADGAAWLRRAPLLALGLLALGLAAAASGRWLAPLLGWPEARFASLEAGALASCSLEALLFALALLLAAQVARGRVRPSLAPPLLALLLAAELAAPALRLERTAPAADWTGLPALPALLAADARAPLSTFRISSQSTGMSLETLDALAAADGSSRSLALFRLRRAALFDSTGARAGVRSDRGYSGFTPGALQRLYTRARGGEVLELLGVRYAIDFGGGPSLYASLGYRPRPDLAIAALAAAPSLAAGALRVFESPRAQPGAWLSPAVLGGEHRGEVPRCSDRFVPWLDADELRRLPDAVPRGESCDALSRWLQTQPSLQGEPPQGQAAEWGSAQITSFAPERLAVQVDAPAASLLVLAESALPGWRAFVDGAETEPLHADGALRACAVPAGRHEVLFTYRTPGLRTGAWVSLASLALAALLAAIAARRGAR